MDTIPLTSLNRLLLSTFLKNCTFCHNSRDKKGTYSTLLSQKKAAYPAYRKARDEMQELMKAQKNVEIFFAEEKTTKEKAQTR